MNPFSRNDSSQATLDAPLTGNPFSRTPAPPASTVIPSSGLFSGMSSLTAQSTPQTVSPDMPTLGGAIETALPGLKAMRDSFESGDPAPYKKFLTDTINNTPSIFHYGETIGGTKLTSEELINRTVGEVLGFTGEAEAIKKLSDAAKLLLKESTSEGSAKILSSLNVPQPITDAFAPKFAAANTPEQVNGLLDHMKDVIATKPIVENAEMPLKAPTEALPKQTPSLALPEGEVASAAARADQALQNLSPEMRGEISSLTDMVEKRATEVKEKVNIIDYLRTPERVLEKIGFGDEAKILRQGYEDYIKELPKNIEKISEWAKQVPAESAKTIFQFLDGEKVTLSPVENKVAGEIKTWLAQWADRLKLPEDQRISHYITHIFDRELINKEFDENLAKIITDKIPGSVYDPFLQQRLGKTGYKQNVWEALDAYAKRATRKVNMDPALEAIKSKAGSSMQYSNIEASQFNYIKRYAAGINMRPTELDNLLDNTIKNFVGYKYGQRPVTYLTKLLRQMTYRGMIGLNAGSALRNISQGVNTYAVLGEKYTALGYLKLFSRGAMKELADEGVFSPGFIQDRTLSATKTVMQKVDKGLFAFFEGAERVNRGSAYFGAKSKALAQGKTSQEAIDYAKSIVRKTQFSFGSIDTPVALQSDIAKTLAQLSNYTIKQVEFLAGLAKNKNFIGLLRYAVGGLAFVHTIGKSFGMDASQLIPYFRFGTPPSLTFPVEAGKAILNTPDKYNKPRSLGQKLKDVAGSTLGLIPAGIQAKKTIQGVAAYEQGKDTSASGKTRYMIPHTPGNLIRSALFGKSSLPQAQKYYSGVGQKKAASNPFSR